MTATSKDFLTVRPWAAGPACIDKGTYLSLNNWTYSGEPLPTSGLPLDTLVALTQAAYDFLLADLVARFAAERANQIVTLPKSGINRTGDNAGLPSQTLIGSPPSSFNP